ncbi:hypothetical protein HDU93_006295 [Gonapodya sp. JEL0774]|nr:hypothetical protein HDU93_006295 [Gonapodya sp. JEL0774]
MSTWIPAFADEIYWLFDHPVRRVEILGTVVAVEVTNRGVVYSLDDGTGVLPAMQWNPRNTPLSIDVQTVPLGVTLRVQGRVSEYLDRKQITISVARAERDPSMQMLWWLQTADMKRRVYSRRLRIARPDFYPPAAAYGSEEMIGLPEIGEDGVPVPLPHVDDAEFRQALKDYIVLHHLTIFDYKSIRSDPTLEAVALAVVSGLPSTQAKPDVLSLQRINTVFTRAMHHLVQCGDLRLVDPKADMYEVIAPEGNLGAFVREAIAQMMDLHNPERSVDGIIKVDRLFVRLKETKKFERVSRHKLLATMQLLVEANEIYEISRGEYRLT